MPPHRKHINHHVRGIELIPMLTTNYRIRSVTEKFLLSTILVSGIGLLLLQFVPLTTVLPTCAPIWACIFSLSIIRR